MVTKPPFPPRDGGRLLLWNTLGALTEEGLKVPLVAPRLDLEAAEIETLATRCRPLLVDEPRWHRSWPRALALGLLSARPPVLQRHHRPRLRAAVLAAVREHRPTVVHAEQLHAFSALPRLGDTPRLLRSQNVESDLWTGYGRVAPGLRRGLARVAGAWLRRVERAAVRDACLCVAVSESDARTLRALAGAGYPVETVLPPFPSELEPAAGDLPGDPSIVLFAGGWLPNQIAARRFVEGVWPAIRARLPGARLHLFGNADRRLEAAALESHPAPESSRAVFARGVILAVPLEVASGIRIKVLESWARGAPVVASTLALRGLPESDEPTALVADAPEEWSRQVARLHEESGLRSRLTAAGRALLARCFGPRRIAHQWLDVYCRATATAKTS